jgi:glycerate-2-kinase
MALTMSGQNVGLTRAAKLIWEAAIRAAEPGRLVRKAVIRHGDVLQVKGREHDLARFENVFLIGFGKAAPAMASTFMDIAGDRVRDGLVVALPGSNIQFPGLTVCEAPHPLPDRRSVAAAETALRLAGRARERDLVVVLLSGGGSSQVCAPAAGLTLEEKIAVTRELLRRGADIFALNAVRKHLSAIKGGRLAQAAAPAAVLSLVISDVPGDDLETIASGPTHWDSSAFEDARRTLDRFGLWPEAPPGVKRVIEEGCRGVRPETLKKDDPAFRTVSTHVVGSNALALAAARTAAERLGFRTFVLSSADRGEARDVACRYASLLLSAASSANRGDAALGFLSGGELTVSVRGGGKGGRNQEFVLAALEFLEGRETRAESSVSSSEISLREVGRWASDWLVASVGTDGVDGGTDAAGAWAGPATAAAARRLGLSPRAFLDNNDSYHFFQKTGGLIITGPTGTNVMDVRIMLLGPPSPPDFS